MNQLLNDDFGDLLDLFKKHQVEFVVVGAWALAAHGLPRATGDIDLMIRPSPENALRVIDALKEFGAPLESHAITAADFSKGGEVYQIGLPPRRIDLLTEISGVPTDDVFLTAEVIKFSGRDLPVLSRETLLKNKRATGRKKDELDVEALEASSKKGV